MFQQKVYGGVLRASICIAAFLVGTPNLHSQTPVPDATPQPGPITTLSVTTRLVILDTVVTDRSGKIVSGLTRDDFRIYQDNVEQKIRNFDAVTPKPDLPTTPRKDHNGHDDWGDAPKVILVLDELNTPFEEIAYSRYEVNRYLNSKPAILPGPTMVLYVNDRGFHPLGVYTKDRAALLKEVAAHRPDLPGSFMRGDGSEMLARSFALLQQIAISTRGESGRKLVLWIGRGFSGFNPKDLLPDDQDRLDSAIRYTTNLLLDARITLFKIDPSPTTPPPDIMTTDDGDVMVSDTPIQDPFAENFNFNTFVQQTGGRFFYGRNDLDKEIDTGVNEGETFYTLTYVPAADLQAATYHGIKIVMRNKNLTARTRLGYYPASVASATPTGKALAFDVYEAAVSGMTYSGVGMRVRKCTSQGGAPQTTCHIQIDTSSLTFETTPEGDHKTTLIVILVSLDAKGKIIATSARSMTDRVLAADSQPLSIGHIDIPFEGVVPANAHSARIIVRDVSGRIGTADIELGMPPHRFM